MCVVCSLKHFLFGTLYVVTPRFMYVNRLYLLQRSFALDCQSLAACTSDGSKVIPFQKLATVEDG